MINVEYQMANDDNIIEKEISRKIMNNTLQMDLEVKVNVRYGIYYKNNSIKYLN